MTIINKKTWQLQYCLETWLCVCVCVCVCLCVSVSVCVCVCYYAQGDNRMLQQLPLSSVLVVMTRVVVATSYYHLEHSHTHTHTYTHTHTHTHTHTILIFLSQGSIYLVEERQSSKGMQESRKTEAGEKRLTDVTTSMKK